MNDERKKPVQWLDMDSRVPSATINGLDEQLDIMTERLACSVIIFAQTIPDQPISGKVSRQEV